MKLNRSQKLLITTEARVLKILREAKGMTMQEAANAIGNPSHHLTKELLWESLKGDLE